MSFFEFYRAAFLLFDAMRDPAGLARGEIMYIGLAERVGNVGRSGGTLMRDGSLVDFEEFGERMLVVAWDNGSSRFWLSNCACRGSHRFGEYYAS